MNAPSTFGKYLLLERINVGGMAEVFKAKAFGVEGFERIIAIKRILPNMAEDDEFINMFIDEARIAVQLSHANVVQIYELGKFENQYYMAMEYVFGRDLRQILDRYRKRQQTLPLPAAAYIASRICEGLDYAHRKTDPGGRPLGVVHRDVSPQNIMVSYEGAVKITDFGIAKAEDRASKTQAGVLKGKFGYMSPEQVRGLEIDRRSDVFAVGILLYEMVTGRRLFMGESDFSTLEKVRNAEVTPPTQLNPSIPPELERVMLKALARERDERYAWASDLHDDLQQFLIEENTIFNAKRLSALMKQDFQAEIDAEMQKMEEFMRATPPASAEAAMAAEQMRQAPVAQGQKAIVSDEKTMIFEQDMSAMRGSTQVADGDNKASGARGAGRPVNEGRTGSVVVGGSSGKSAERSSPGTKHRATRGRPRSPRRLGTIVVSASVLLSVLILVAVLFAGKKEMGTIIVTSTPTSAVELELDGVRIGDKTPLVYSDIPVGRHELVARAAGFVQKTYTFELAAVRPAQIDLVLERAVAIASRDAILEVASEPEGATVRAGDAIKGTTPLSLSGLDPTQPVVFAVSKEGYQTENVTVTFPAGQTRARHVVTLKPAAAAGTAGRLIVRSTPGGAEVSVDGQSWGVTPVERTVDSKTPHEVQLAKDGYRAHKETVRLDGKLEATIEATLVPKKDEHPRPLGGGGKPGKPPEKAAEKGGGGKAAASAECSGSAGVLSVMPIGEADCESSVGGTRIGIGAFSKKPVPSGQCEIKIVCPSGKKFSETKALKPGTEVKVIVRPQDWR